MKLQKNIRELLPIGILALLAVAPLSAQNSLPNPHDASCWESLSALHACALEQYDRDRDQAERCTSYPEYQCASEPEQKTAAEEVAKSKSQKGSANHDAAMNAALSPGSAPAQPSGSK